ncbi:helix-turn-helix domain-containing protein [uncultured Rikenella sp.]|uniref:helix-turn-helix domain-containing protein n=2 Tax=uncultured Rikenella sp. TaxID=368003 RepID=UPI0023D6A1A6|nr:helix-turn-helix domain-containing protein [uncultured Rikenella sp.]MDE5944083.1 helix-turn-helix domain-containing protein [Rikenella sp.]
MSEVIVMTPDQLRGTLEGAVLGALEKFQASQKEAARPENQPEAMNLPAAIRFLAENGYPTSRSKFYQLTSTGKIPHRKYGSRLVFNRTELLRWAESQAKECNTGQREAVALIARSARNHQNR